MVAFGKKLKERSIEEWQEYVSIILKICLILSLWQCDSCTCFFRFLCRYYINYKLMKKKVKQYGPQIEVGSLDRRHVLKDFSRMLDHQVFFIFIHKTSRFA